jgi:hypothetical protein
MNKQSIEEKLALDRKDRRPGLRRASEGEEMARDVGAWNEGSSSMLDGTNKEESGHGKGWEVNQDITQTGIAGTARRGSKEGSKHETIS